MWVDLVFWGILLAALLAVVRWAFFPGLRNPPVATPSLAGLAEPVVTGPAYPDRTVAALLAVFLGTVGAHRFYLRRWAQGVVCIAFFWTLVPTIVGVIDGLWYLSMSPERFRARCGARLPTSMPTDVHRTG